MSQQLEQQEFGNEMYSASVILEKLHSLIAAKIPEDFFETMASKNLNIQLKEERFNILGDDQKEWISVFRRNTLFGWQVKFDGQIRQGYFENQVEAGEIFQKVYGLADGGMVKSDT